MEEITSFGEWLKQRRKALDLTQEELAQRLGVAVGTLRKWETEERRPSKEIASRLGALLEIPSGECVTFVRVARGELPIDRLGLTPEQLMHPRTTATGARREGPPGAGTEQVTVLPTGTVTFLFTDIEGSAALWERHPVVTRAALVQHDMLVEEIVAAHNGVVVRPRGEGDSRFAVFERATDAVSAAVAVQRAFHDEPWSTPKPLRIRAALHTGEAERRAGDYYGSAVNRCARIRDLGHGGQTLLSQTTYTLVRDQLEHGALADLDVRSLGEVRLKGLSQPERIFQLVIPGLPAMFPPLTTTPAADRSRSRILVKVRDFWVKGVLEQSLYYAALIDLGLMYKPDAVAPLYPWGLHVQRSDSQEVALPSGTTIASVFDTMEGQLLILGAPGSGKTIMLLELTRTLLDRAEQDVAHPLPIVFNLASWARYRQALTVWLVAELHAHYQVPKQVAQKWVDTNQIIPLLDGLDEVAHEYRAACIAAINEFQQSRTPEGLVVCSRIEEYEAFEAQLSLRGAVVLQPLTLPQVDAYFTQVGPALASVHAAFAHDAALRDLVRSPLMLSIITLAYKDVSAAGLQSTSATKGQWNPIFATYVQRMLERPATYRLYSVDVPARPPWQRKHPNTSFAAQQTVQWLGWVAQTLLQRAETLFFVERLQPDVLDDAACRRSYVVSLGTIVGLVVAVTWGLAWGTVNGLMFGRDGVFVGLIHGGINGVTIGLLVGLVVERRVTSIVPGYRPWRSIHYSLRFGLIVGLGVGLAGGVLGSLIVGLIGGLALGLAGGVASGLAGGLTVGLIAHPRSIDSVERLHWSWTTAKVQLLRKIVFGLVTGLGIGLVLGLANGLAWKPAWGLMYGVASGLASGLTVGISRVLATGLVTGEMETKTVPNQGIWWSAYNAVSVTVAFGVAGGLIFGLTYGFIFELGSRLVGLGSGFGVGFVAGLAHGPGVGILAGLVYGGFACMQHAVLRYLLYQEGAIPWHYVHFLDYCTERSFLQKVGGGYIFVHRLLLEYFATLYESPGRLSCVDGDRPGGIALAADRQPPENKRCEHD